MRKLLKKICCPGHLYKLLGWPLTLTPHAPLECIKVQLHLLARLQQNPIRVGVGQVMPLPSWEKTGQHYRRFLATNLHIINVFIG